MSKGMNISVDISDLMRGLKRLDAALRADVIKNATVAGAMEIGNEWRDSMTREPTTYRTGQYRRSVQERVLAATDKRAEVTVATDISDPPYPRFLEFGTSKMAARPKARPAFDNKKDVAIDVFNIAMRAQVLKAAK